MTFWLGELSSDNRVVVLRLIFYHIIFLVYITFIIGISIHFYTHARTSQPDYKQAKEDKNYGRDKESDCDI
ncbi:hypothetical protein CMV16_21855 [Peribacillus simplex]|nr:hypothetical protein CMV16_21855 [Peribacillus simplex]